MSTIASPRDTSTSGRRIPLISTPTTSSRPSLDSPRGGIRSTSASPNRGPSNASAQLTQQPRRNRAALREYYNLKAQENHKGDDASSEYSVNDSDVVESELDRDGFDGEGYVRHVLETQSLEELLKTYNQVLSEIRALDAEKKALVYDNYSKLIAATDTIRRMRTNMDPLNPMASTLDPAIAHIYERANTIKAELKASIEDSKDDEDEQTKQKKKKAALAARRVLETPERLRELVRDGRVDEARGEWQPVLEVLQRWKDKGIGGKDVQDCIDDGEAALRGEEPNEKSWKSKK